MSTHTYQQCDLCQRRFERVDLIPVTVQLRVFDVCNSCQKVTVKELLDKANRER